LGGRVGEHNVVLSNVLSTHLQHNLEQHKHLTNIDHTPNIMSNQAAWIPEAKGKLEVKEAPMPKAGKGEVIIKNHAVAVNPVDC
jgi:hypothetical protein